MKDARGKLVAIFVAGLAAGVASSAADSGSKPPDQDWPIYGGAGQIRYSPLRRINRSNVARLKVAWSYDTDDGSNASQTQPIVVEGVPYGAATNFDRKFRAFDKKTGALLWETTLPMSGNATPITYSIGGRQYVAIYATGGRKRGDPSGAFMWLFHYLRRI